MNNQQNHNGQPQEYNLDCQIPKTSFGPLNKRNIKDIQKMIQNLKESQDTTVHVEVSYEEACQQYKYYKSKTLKANVNELDFKQNMEFREFFLGIKKRYDMQMRAQKFRQKQKREIAMLKKAVEDKKHTEEDAKVELSQVDEEESRPVE